MGRVISTAIQFIDGFTKPSKEVINSMRSMGNEAIKAGETDTERGQDNYKRWINPRNSHRDRNNTDKNVRRRKRNNRGRYTVYNGRKRGNGARGRNGSSYAVKNMRHRLRKRGGLKC